MTKSPYSDWIDKIGTALEMPCYRDQNSDSLALLVRLAQQFAPTKIVELGTHLGLSLRAWVHAATGAEIITVDIGGLKGVERGYGACPFDLTNVRGLKANVRNLYAHDLWGQTDRVLLYCDVHGVETMEHVLSELVPFLPPGSLVVADDVWASDFDFFDKAGFQRFFDRRIAQDVDPNQPTNRPSSWGRYRGTGRPVAGFAEVVPLVDFVNRHRLDCRFESKVMWFYPGVEPMTIFTTCKPFHGQAGEIQENALKSWTLLQPRPEIIVMGNDEGAEDIARRLGIRHEPVIGEVTKPPKVDLIFWLGQMTASSDLIAYVNADIILGQRFILAAQSARHAFDFDMPFLMTGLRWDLMDWRGLEIGSAGWWEELEARVMQSGQFHRATGADYFVFQRRLYQDVPDFYIGHSAWDNWLIMDVVRRGLPVVNATPFVWAVHHGLERCDITDRRYKHNQKIWRRLMPKTGEGMIESAGWVIDFRGRLHEAGGERFLEVMRMVTNDRP